MTQKSLSPELNLHVSFFLKERGISKVALSLTDQGGLTWSLSGTSAHLEELIAQWMSSYAQGKEPVARLPLIFDSIPPYTQAVLLNLKKLPFGHSLSYSELAIKTGNPKAARAVGNACSRNPFPLIVPCHRILAQGHRLGGFSLDMEIKHRLLAFENISFK